MPEKHHLHLCLPHYVPVMNQHQVWPKQKPENLAQQWTGRQASKLLNRKMQAVERKLVSAFWEEKVVGLVA